MTTVGETRLLLLKAKRMGHFVLAFTVMVSGLYVMGSVFPLSIEDAGGWTPVSAYYAGAPNMDGKSLVFPDTLEDRPMRSLRSTIAPSTPFPTWIAYLSAIILAVGMLMVCFWYRLRRRAQQAPTPLLAGRMFMPAMSATPQADLEAAFGSTVPATRRDIFFAADSDMWYCEVCDFGNRKEAPRCLLCGTEKGFSFHLPRPSADDPTVVTPQQHSQISSSFSGARRRSLVIRTLNRLNERQKSARHRQDWVRERGPDGRWHWARKKKFVVSTPMKKELELMQVDAQALQKQDKKNKKEEKKKEKAKKKKNKKGKTSEADEADDSSRNGASETDRRGAGTSIAGDEDKNGSFILPLSRSSSTSTTLSIAEARRSISRSSLVFVSRIAAESASDAEEEGGGRLTFTEVSQVDPSMALQGYQISPSDLEVLELVAALPFVDKYAWFMEQTGALMKDWEEGRLRMRLHRENVLVESMEQLLGVQPQHIHLPLRIEFIGESGVDAGGLEREWFALLSQAVFDDRVGLFTCCHLENLAYTICPDSEAASVDHLLYFRGVGRLIGRAFLEGQLLQAHLCLPLLKHVLSVPISFEDLQFMDPELYNSLKWMKENEGVADLCLDFTVTEKRNGKLEVIELFPGGKDSEVTDANKKDYINRRLRYAMLDSIAEQLKYLLLGLFEVIPQELLLVFDYQELELVLCGVPDIDVDDWERHAVKSGELLESEAGKKAVAWFWETVRSMNMTERARLLQYSTGSSRVPPQGFKALTSYDGRVCPFTLKGVPVADHPYPRAHTCFNRIDLPLYKSKKQMEEVLLTVINLEITGFTDE